MCIRDRYSGYGIGTLLLKDTLSKLRENKIGFAIMAGWINNCLLYTSDAADERSSVDLGGRRIIKKKKKI